MSFEDHPINLLNAAGAPDFVTVEAQLLLDRAISFFEAGTGRTLSPSQVEMYLLETIAYMMSVRGGEEQLALENGFVAYSRDKWLDLHGADRSTPRLEAVPATTTLRFSRIGPAVSRIRIPAGTRVSDAGGQVQFATQELAYIEAGQAQIDVSAASLALGMGSNNYPIGALSIIIDTVPGIASVTNLTVTGAGAEREETARYRVRVALAFERLGDGLTQERYVSDVLAWNARCIDVDVQRPQAGHVNIYPLMDSGAPNPEEIASLQDDFGESNTHQGDFIQVFAPTAQVFAFELALTLSDPDAEAPATAAVQSVLDFWATTLGGYFAPSELIRVAKETVNVVEADIPNQILTLVADNSWRKCTITTVTVTVV